jgi:hypothetical protein
MIDVDREPVRLRHVDCDNLYVAFIRFAMKPTFLARRSQPGDEKQARRRRHSSRAVRSGRLAAVGGFEESNVYTHKLSFRFQAGMTAVHAQNRPWIGLTSQGLHGRLVRAAPCSR